MDMNDLDETLIVKVKDLFNGAKGYIFEDGVDSPFSRGLTGLINIYGCEVIEIISYLIKSSNIYPHIIGEALRWIGLIEHSPSYEIRLTLLLYCLESNKPIVKDGAILGLSFLDDRRSVPQLKKARDKEKVKELKKDMSQILRQWEGRGGN